MSDAIFVGRDTELLRLHSLLESSISGSGRICFVTGEAGTGKSTLVQQFCEQAQARNDTVTVVLGRSNAQTGAGDPYLPFMEILTMLAGEQSHKTAAVSDTYSSRLRKLAKNSAKVLIDVAPDIINAFVPSAALLTKIGETIIREVGSSLQDASNAPRKPLAPGELDSLKIYQQFTDLLATLSRQAPLILILDDMHWADTASINLFSHLSVKLKDCPVLLLGTYRGNDLALTRRDERHPLIPALNELKRQFGDIVIDLETIRQDERRRFVDSLIDVEANRLDERFRVQLLEHTNGHPLFTVELLQSFKENGTLVKDADARWIPGHALDWRVLPPRLEGVIEERIGRVEERMRDILVSGSVEGLCFTAQIVAQLQNMTEREILKCLSQELEKRHCLVKEGSTEKIGKNWLSQFTFSHALFQQYLYNELSERQRMILHGDIADVLEELYRDKRDSVLLQLARHYDIADEPEKAAACLIRASSLAMRISAYDEALLQLLRALELLGQVPDGEARQRLELDAQITLFLLYRATRGWDAPELIAACNRARELCNALQLPLRLAPILFGLWSSHLMNLGLPKALQMAQEYHQLAIQSGDKDMQLHAYIALGNTYFWMGRMTEARQSLAEAQQRFTEERDYIDDFGQDPGVVCFLLTSFCAWLQGETEAAIDCCNKALARAEKLAHPFSHAIALYGAATIDHHVQDVEAMTAHTAQLVKICREHHFPLYLGLGMVYQGWLGALNGNTVAGMTVMEAGFRDWICKHGGKITHSLYRVMQAEALQRGGQYDAALAAVETGLKVVHECAEHCYEPELHRLRAELLAASDGAREDIECAYLKAIEVSQTQGQVNLKIRAETSHARYLQSMEGTAANRY